MIQHYGSRRKVFLLLNLFVLLTGISCYAQNIIAIETFGSRVAGSSCDEGTLANGFVSTFGTGGSWVVTPINAQQPFANEWWISSTESGEPEGACSGTSCISSASVVDRTLHIGSVPNSPNASVCVFGDCGAIYDPGQVQGQVSTDKRAESPEVDLSTDTGVYVTFLYLLGGQPGFDYGKVEWYNGISWLPLTDPVITATCGGVVPGRDIPNIFLLQQIISLILKLVLNGSIMMMPAEYLHLLLQSTALYYLQFREILL
jgi:hypothetical protein